MNIPLAQIDESGIKLKLAIFMVSNKIIIIFLLVEFISEVFFFSKISLSDIRIFRILLITVSNWKNVYIQKLYNVYL